MQMTMIAGTVGRDAELRKTQGGDPILSFSLAVENGKDREGNKRDATWFDCSIWGKRGEALQSHIVKGSKLTLTGRVSAREHNGKIYMQLNVNDLTFQGGGQRQEQSSYGSGGTPMELDDSIPFAPQFF